MSGAGARPITFGPFRLDLGARRLTHNDVELMLGGRAFDVLAALAGAGGGTLTKDALLATVWHGQVVEENNLQKQVSALRKLIGEGWIVTIPNRGYRLVLAPPTDPLMLTAAPMAVPDRPSIAVLPFANLSGDPEQEYFADGMAEDVTTVLSRIGGLFVIARNSAFTYKGRAINLQQVSRELGVRYVLEGSVRRAGGRVRIACQLIDASSGVHVWADRFDAELNDIFELQDRVSESVAGAIEPNLLRAEIARALRKPTGNLTAYDLYLRAQAAAQLRSRADLEDAVRLVRSALAADPGFALAAAFGAHVINRLLATGGVNRGDNMVAEGIAFARRALAHGRDDALTLAYASTIRSLDPEHAIEIGRQAARRALQINPNSALAVYAVANSHLGSDRMDEALRMYDRTLLLSPLDPDLPAILTNKAAALIGLGHYETALTIIRSARAQQDVPLHGWIIEVAALCRLDRVDEAHTIVQEIRAAHPDETISRICTRFRAFPQRMLDIASRTLREAGVPE